MPTPSIFIIFYYFFVSGSGEALRIMQKRFCFKILLSADKNAKKLKIKILKWSVWEAQAKAISSTSLRDIVSTHTASESTRLVQQLTREFFSKFCFGVSCGPCQFFIFSQIVRNGQFGRLRQKLSPPPVWEIQFRLILHLKAEDLFDNKLESFFRNFALASLGGHGNFSFWA